ncbi:MAG TPA: ABC transporter permease subunit [Acidimicrobiia bacterium]|nr:ABC transporter permease subunit [Acidimicrobiia bacterium]
MNDRNDRDDRATGRDGDPEVAVSAGPAVAIEPDEEAGPGPVPAGTTGRRIGGRELAVALLFLVPALVILGVWLVYPVLFTVWRSFFDNAGEFAGIDNYREMFTRDSTRTAIKNNFIWVAAAPTIATAVGLVFAVLTERIKFGTAFKLIIFMPMAISFLAAGVIFRFVYDEDPDRGLANAILTTITDVWQEPGRLIGATASDPDRYERQGQALLSTATYRPGDEVLVGIVGIRPQDMPDDAEPAAPPPSPSEDAITGTVWLDFTRGGGGERGAIDPSEVGLAGVKMEIVDDTGDVVGSDSTDDAGVFTVDGLEPGTYRAQVAPANFDVPWTGVRFLGDALVTPSIIGSFLWIWAGFAMVVIAAGLAAIPRETLEAARVDGASEWQVFRRVTVPLLWPVLLVVVVTLVINVLKIFDLVLIVPPGNVQDDANVIALELIRVAFGANNEGLGSALGVLLFVLVIPAMLFNIRRFRTEEG